VFFLATVLGATATPQSTGSVSTNFWMPVPATTGPVQVAPPGKVQAPTMIGFR
jgi:hypothetical protein